MNGARCGSTLRHLAAVRDRGHFETAEDDKVAPALGAVQNIDVPEEIKSQWATVIETTRKAAELEKSDGGRFEGTAATEQAAERILSYVNVQCSVDLSS